jgi:hypothetical protein
MNFNPDEQRTLNDTEATAVDYQFESHVLLARRQINQSQRPSGSMADSAINERMPGQVGPFNNLN